METKRVKVRWVEYEYDAATYNVERSWFQLGESVMATYDYSASANMIRFICNLFEEGPYSKPELEKVIKARLSKKSWWKFLSKNEEGRLPVVIIKDGANVEIGIAPERLAEIYQDISEIHQKMRKEANVSEFGLN